MAEGRDWSQLPSDVIFEIMTLMGTKDRLRASYVYRSWLKTGRERPQLWTVIHMEKDEHELAKMVESMCLEAIRRSGGGCVDFTVRRLGMGGTVMLDYLLRTCTGLLVLRLEDANFLPYHFESHLTAGHLEPLLELEFTNIWICRSIFESMIWWCRSLRILKVIDCMPNLHWALADHIAWGIGGIYQVHELSMQGFNLSDEGAVAIVLRNPSFRLLDLRGC